VFLLLFGAGCKDADTPLAPVPPDPLESPVLSALSAWSASADLVVIWSQFDGAEVQVEQATDPGFTSGGAVSPWLDGGTWHPTNLSHGRTYYFRARARQTGRAVSPASAVVATTVDNNPPTAVLLDPGPDQTSLTFTLDWTATDDHSGVSSVTLWSRRPAEAWTQVDTYDAPPAVYTASAPGPMDFRVTARDRVGNRQDPTTAVVRPTTVPVPIIITDLQGEDFDITNAVLRYGIAEAFWGYGLGRNAIRPIINPRFVGPGEPGYLSDRILVDVMGVEFDGDARAYRVNDLTNREVANDVVQGVHLAATY